jgi:hypothetical protein
VSADVRVVAAAFSEVLAGRLRSLIAQPERNKKIPEKPVLLSLTRSFCKEYFARLIDGISKLQTENW